MERVVTAANMRRLEQAAVDAGDSYAALMERAGIAASDAFIKRMAFSDRDIVLVLCGGGNNGGDGFVIAERLCEKTDAAVYVLLCAQPQTELARDRFRRLSQTRAIVNEWDEETQKQELPAFVSNVTCVIDAVYGIGYRGALPASLCVLFDHIRQTRLPVLAVDIPSGLAADDGTADPHTLHATMTVTFTAKKPTMASAFGRTFCGELVIADVGIPTSLTARCETPLHFLTEPDVRVCFEPRPADSHKGTFGSVLSLCGSYGMAGAALLCGKAALRCGAGLLHMALPASVYPIVASQLWEAVCHPLAEVSGCIAASQAPKLAQTADGVKAVVVGCGLSQTEEAVLLLEAFLPQIKVPLILDADGLNILSAHTHIGKAIKAPLIVTPHPLEMARLLDATVEAVQRDRIGAAVRYAAMSGAVTVLKGHRTVIAAPTGEVFINPTGNCGLATGGSGDVLSGMIASFVAQGMAPLDAACCGVFLHGRAAELTAEHFGVTAMLPTDLIEALPSLLSQYEKRE